MMENVEELTKRGFTLDLPTVLPVEEERNYGGDRRFGMRPGGSSRGGCVHLESSGRDLLGSHA